MRSLITTSLAEDFKQIGIPLAEEAKTPEQLDEVGRRTRLSFRAGSAKKTKVNKGTASQKMGWKKANRKPKRKLQLKKYRAKTKTKMKQKRNARIRARMGDHNQDSVSNMLESTQSILASLEEDKVTNELKGFAQLALMAEMLSRSFSRLAVDFEEDEDDLTQASEFYSQLAEQAAEIAKALKMNEAVDEQAVSDIYQSSTADVLTGLKMFEAYTGEDDEEDSEETETVSEGDDSDDDDEDDDDEDEEEEDDDDEDEEEEDDDMEESSPPWRAKGKK
jgi:hypothetical protein